MAQIRIRLIGGDWNGQQMETGAEAELIGRPSKSAGGASLIYTRRENARPGKHLSAALFGLEGMSDAEVDQIFAEQWSQCEALRDGANAVCETCGLTWPYGREQELCRAKLV